MTEVVVKRVIYAFMLPLTQNCRIWIVCCFFFRNFSNSELIIRSSLPVQLCKDNGWKGHFVMYYSIMTDASFSCYIEILVIEYI